jgi:hypothetical protein
MLGAALVIAATLLVAVRLPRLCVDHPVATLLFAGAVTLVAAAYVVRPHPLGFRIDLDPSSEPLLVNGDPGKERYERALLDFGGDDVCVIAMEAADVFTEADLRTLSRVTDRIRQLPGVRAAESLTNATSFRYDPDARWVEVGQFIDEIPSDPAELARLRERALSDKLFAKTLVSVDGHSAAINVAFEAMTDREFVERDLDGRILQILALESSPARRFFITGRPHIRAQAHHLMVSDLLRLIPVAIAVAALSVGITTGSLRHMLIPLVNCLLATLWAFGAMAATGKDMNVITLVVGPCLIVIASVYGVYVVEAYHEVAGEAPDPRTAAASALEATRAPVVISGLTEVVGFLAQLANDIPATTELGLFCAFGFACATILTLTVAPAWLALLPLERRGAAHGAPVYADRNRLAAWLGARLDDALAALWRVEVRRPAVFLWVWAAVALGAALVVPRIVIDTDYLTFFDPDSNVRTDFDAVNRLLSGTVPIYVVFEGDAEGAFREPKAVAALEGIEARLEAIPGVSQVNSMADIVRALNRALAEDDPAAERVPDTRQGLAEVIFMIPKDRLRRFATSDHSDANLIVRTATMGSAAVRELERRIAAEVRDPALPPGIRAYVTGNTVLINHSADGIAGTQLWSIGLASLTIFALVFAVFRQWKISVVAMVPNLLPVLLFYGMLGAGAAPLSVPTSMIGTIVLGITVDDTVHFLTSYRRERAAGKEPADATLRCLRFVGRAMVIASIMLSVGFNVMNLSEFATLRQFGYLAGATLVVCLVTDLLLLPALLVAWKA